MGLGQEHGNEHKDVELKEQMDATTRRKEILNRTKPETSERHQ